MSKSHNLRKLLGTQHDVLHHQIELMTWVWAVKNPGPFFADHRTALLNIASGVGDNNRDTPSHEPYDDLPRFQYYADVIQLTELTAVIPANNVSALVDLPVS